MSKSPAVLLAALALASVAAPAAATDRADAEVALSAAETAVQTAGRDDAAHYAPDELAGAQAMLAAARDAYASRAWNEAAIDAERARVDGDLASARSRQQRAEAATAEIERSLATLRAQPPLPGDTP